MTDRDLGQPTPRIYRRPGFVATSTLSVMALGAAVAAACSGGNGEVGGAKSNPTTGQTIEVKGEAPTSTIAIPTPTEVQKPSLKLADAQFKPTTFEEMVASIDAAYQTHPDIAQMSYKGGPPQTRERQDQNIAGCQTGVTFKAGTPIAPDAKSVSLNRADSCSNLISLFVVLYRQTGYSELYVAAVTTANYALTEVPDRKGHMDQGLSYNAQDTTPSLPH